MKNIYTNNYGELVQIINSHDGEITYQFLVTGRTHSTTSSEFIKSFSILPELSTEDKEIVDDIIAQCICDAIMAFKKHGDNFYTVALDRRLVEIGYFDEEGSIQWEDLKCLQNIPTIENLLVYRHVIAELMLHNIYRNDR